MIIYVDIDGTICHTKNSDYPNSLPRYNQIDKINKLFDEGHYITYWTARGASSKGIGYWHKLTMDQLLDWGCKFHELKVVGSKPSYDLWVDDKAVKIEEL